MYLGRNETDAGAELGWGIVISGVELLVEWSDAMERDEGAERTGWQPGQSLKKKKSRMDCREHPDV